MLSNVVYPVYTCGKYIRHSTPGRWWDCLYTWDSGFIGLGLLELDIERAKENLRLSNLRACRKQIYTSRISGTSSILSCQ